MESTSKVTVSNQIDLIYIFKLLLSKKLLFCKTMGIAMVVGIIVALSIPKTYKTEVTLAPEFSSSGSVSGSLSDLASMVGINLNSGTGSYDAIYPELYPQIISSTPFLTSLFDVPVTSSDSVIKNVRLYDYLNTKQKSTWWNKIIASVIRLFKKKKPGDGTHKLDNFKLTKAEFDTMGALRGLISCSVDKKTSIITLSFVAQDPVISAAVILYKEDCRSMLPCIVQKKQEVIWIML